MRVVFLSMGLAAVMSLMTGCSSKCESVCADHNACDLKERPTNVDCPEFCADAEAFNERAVDAGGDSCQAQFDAHLECWENNSGQMCSTEFDGCAESGAAWTECMAAHCEANSEDEEANPDPNCFGADPALYPF
ncbi:MAG TPA: hypothetical protein VF815_23015 [Myxococcaceae bacterium]